MRTAHPLSVFWVVYIQYWLITFFFLLFTVVCGLTWPGPEWRKGGRREAGKAREAKYRMDGWNAWKTRIILGQARVCRSLGLVGWLAGDH